MKALNRSIAWSAGLLVAMVVFGQAASAHVDSKTCKVKTADIGTIVGHGANRDAAFEDAASQCFDRHSALYRSHKGQDLDEDTGVDVIDQCANIKCS